MPPKEFLLKLQQEGILTEGIKNKKQYLHLKTPCKIHLTEKAIKQLKETYDPSKEKGGVMSCSPEKVDGETYLTIGSIIFLKNVADTPERSYRPDDTELNQSLEDTLSNDFPAQWDPKLGIHVT